MRRSFKMFKLVNNECDLTTVPKIDFIFFLNVLYVFTTQALSYSKNSLYVFTAENCIRTATAQTIPNFHKFPQYQDPIGSQRKHNH